MKQRLALAAALALIAAVPAAAAPRSSTMTVAHPWIALPPGGAPTAAGYLTVKNEGKTPDVFLGGSTVMADKFQIHSMTMTGGIMRMREMEHGVPIAPGQTLALTPGGPLHLMVIHPKRPLTAGERIPVTLKFAKAGGMTVTFVVENEPHGEGSAPMR